MTGGTLRAASSVRATGQLSNGAAVQLSDPHTVTLTYGTASGKVDITVQRTRTLAAGANDVLDVYAGSTLLDLFDANAPFRKIKYIRISIASGGDTAGVTIGGAAANAFSAYFGSATDTVTIYPDGPPLELGNPAGKTVDNTHKNIKVLNNGAVPVSYTITIGGTSV